MFGGSKPLLLNKFFDLSTPSMRKGRDRGEKKKRTKKGNNGGNSGHYVVASRPPNGDRLQRRRSCQNHTLWCFLFFLCIWAKLNSFKFWCAWTKVLSFAFSYDWSLTLFLIDINLHLNTQHRHIYTAKHTHKHTYIHTHIHTHTNTSTWIHKHTPTHMRTMRSLTHTPPTPYMM